MPAYNAYRHPDAEGQDEQILLRPLFLLAFLLDEDLVARKAGGVLLSSASSKTASAIAFLLASRGCHVIGLTSPRNERFVRDLGVYDEVVAYDAIDALPRRSVAFVDVAGDERVRERVHEHFRADLIFSGFVGATHLDPSAFATPPAPDYGPQPELVSANALLRERVRATGQDRLDDDIARAWARYVAWSDGWLTVRRAGGPDAVRAAFLDILGGRVAPNEAHVVSMHSSL
jgi:hypothetical protein